jgi:hypothetical protein
MRPPGLFVTVGVDGLGVPTRRKKIGIAMRVEKRAGRSETGLAVSSNLLEALLEATGRLPCRVTDVVSSKRR